MGTYTTSQTFGTTVLHEALVDSLLTYWDASADAWSIKLLTQDIGLTSNQSFETASAVAISANTTTNKMEMASPRTITIPEGKEVYKIEVLHGTDIIWEELKTGAEIEFEYGGDYIVTAFSITITN